MTNALSCLLQLYTLVVVDMQQGFAASQDVDTIEAVLDEIKSAMAMGMPIVVLQVDWEKFGKTMQPILDLLHGYDSALWVVQDKTHDRDHCRSDGSYEVSEAVEVLGFHAGRFRLCGVNSDVCVFLTAWGLTKRFGEAQVEVVKRACNTDPRWIEGLAGNDDYSHLPHKELQWVSYARYERDHSWYGSVLV